MGELLFVASMVFIVLLSRWAGPHAAEAFATRGEDPGDEGEAYVTDPAAAGGETDDVLAVINALDSDDFTVWAAECAGLERLARRLDGPA